MTAAVDGVIPRFALIDGCKGILRILCGDKTCEPGCGALFVGRPPLRRTGLPCDMVALHLRVVSGSLSVLSDRDKGLFQGFRILLFDLQVIA